MSIEPRAVGSPTKGFSSGLDSKSSPIVAEFFRILIATALGQLSGPLCLRKVSRD
jgi:hypothetical protein